MQFALHLLLLMILQLYQLPPLLPPSVSNSSCLFTPCQSLCARCCTYYSSALSTGGCDRLTKRSVAERNYPTTKVRGGDRERQAATAQEWLRGAGQRGWPRKATPRSRSGAAAERSYPTSEEGQLRGCRRARRATPHLRSGGATSSKVRSSGCALLEQP